MTLHLLLKILFVAMFDVLSLLMPFLLCAVYLNCFMSGTDNLVDLYNRTLRLYSWAFNPCTSTAPVLQYLNDKKSYSFNFLTFLSSSSWELLTSPCGPSRPVIHLHSLSVVCQSYRLWDCTSTPVGIIFLGSSTRPISFNHSQHHCLHQSLIFHSAYLTVVISRGNAWERRSHC